MGRALVAELCKREAQLIALTSSPDVSFGADQKVEVVTWQIGNERELRDRLKNVDILILNHGVNVLGARNSESIYQSYEVNTFSVFRWIDVFLEIVNLINNFL